MPKELNQLWNDTSEFTMKTYTSFSSGNFRTNETFSNNTKELYTNEYFDNSAFNTFTKNQPFFNLIPCQNVGGNTLPIQVIDGKISVKKSLKNN